MGYVLDLEATALPLLEVVTLLLAAETGPPHYKLRLTIVIPAKAGIQVLWLVSTLMSGFPPSRE